MSDLPFTLDQLRILKAIAAEGSFKRAADSLYVSQPAVSLQVQNLERQLDVPLFDRGGRRAQLTEAGHLLLNYGEKILSLCQETCRAIEDLQNLQGGTLIIGASQTTGTYLLPRMIGLFRKRYSDVAVQLHVHSTRRTSWSVANGQIDLAIIGGEVPVELQDSLVTVPYAEDELALILPSFHPLAQAAVVQREDLYKLNFIALDSQSTIRKVIDQVLTRCGVETRRLRIEMELNSIEAIKNAVQSGLGAAFVSVSAIEKELEIELLHRARVEDLTIRRTLSVIYNPNRYRSKAAEAFSQEILPRFASQQYREGFNLYGASEATKGKNGKNHNGATGAARERSSPSDIPTTAATVPGQPTAANEIPDKTGGQARTSIKPGSRAASLNGGNTSEAVVKTMPKTEMPERDA